MNYLQPVVFGNPTAPAHQQFESLAVRVQIARPGSADNRRGLSRLRLVDLLTLSRAAAGVLLVTRAAVPHRSRQGVGAWVAWAALVFAAIPADWLDGPIARRLGSTAYGEVLDLEADSWLTLCSAIAGVRWGRLPSYTILPPLARYPLLLLAARRSSYSLANRDHPSWARPVGMSQMTLFIAALAPFGADMTHALVRVCAPVVAVAQLATLVFVYGRQK